MKNTFKKLSAVVILAIATYSFTTLTKETKSIKTQDSKVTWKGYKVTGSHEGTIAVKSGDLVFEDGKLTGGNIVIDMTTINTTDLQGEYKGKLDGHLKADDFFGVAKHKTASLNFKKVKATSKNAYKVTADLTIKGITNKVTFVISVYGSKATASLKVDRTKFNIKYGSASFFDGLKDKAIYDEFDIVADLVF